MPDIEKVIKGLECCSQLANDDICPADCPYAQDVCCGTVQLMADALELLKVQEELVRCAECKHLFDGEHTENCCDVLMEKAGWLKEISVSPDWFCADGKRR